MDIISIIGMIGSLAAFVYSIIGTGADPMLYIDPSSLIMVFGMTITSAFVAFPSKSLKSFFSVYGKAFSKSNIDLNKDMDRIIKLAETARREGMLQLESSIESIEDPFLQKGIQLVVDSTPTELVRDILENEMYSQQERHATGQMVLDIAAGLAPAYGMLGTLVGLISMLNNLEDSSALGIGMALAMITTLYGSFIANVLCIPISKRLKYLTNMETRQKELILEGILSIYEGESPTVIREKLESYISRKARQQYLNTNKAGGGTSSEPKEGG